MCSCMDECAHDREHVYRVLYNALQIAESEPGTDYDILIAACMLHDIGRQDQTNDPALCHAAVGAEKARTFLLDNGFGASFAECVHHCILTHRFRKNLQPQSLEAKILFDADKLDVTGAIGIARTLVYRGDVKEPLYTRSPDGSICDGSGDAAPSFFREYKFKLEKLYDRFFTHRGRQLALTRRAAAENFYQQLYAEVGFGTDEGRTALEQLLK